MRIFIFLIVLLTLGGISASAFNDCPGCAEAYNIEQLQQTLDKNFKLKTECSHFGGAAGISNCTFAQMCQKFSLNTEAPYIYQNESGEKIPNYSLTSLEFKFNLCTAQKLHKNPGEEMITGMEKMKSQLKENQRKSLQLAVALDDSIRRHNEEKAMFEIGNASIVEALKNLDTNSDSGGIFVVARQTTRNQIEKQFEKMEQRAGYKISEETKKLYVDSQLQLLTGFSDNSLSQEDPSKSRNTNPFLDPFLFSDSKKAGSKDAVIKNQARLQKELDRNYKIFASTQSQILGYLDEKRTPATSDQIDKMKARISSIRMDTETMSLLNPAVCAGPNAFYNPGDHQFHICPQIMELPSESLRMIIAHELAHSIDPCSMSDDLLLVSGKTVAEAMSQPSKEQTEIYEKSAAEVGTFFPKLKDPQPKSNTHFVVDFLGMSKSNLSFIYIKPEWKVFSSGFPGNQNPFSSTLSCLESPDSIHARSVDEKSLAQSMDTAIEKARAAGADPTKDPELQRTMEAKKNLHELLNQHGACSFMGGSNGKSQLQESFADKIASEIVARDLQNKSISEKQKGVFEAAGFFLGISCPNISEKTKSVFSKTAEQQNCGLDSNKSATDIMQIFSAQAHERDEHPWEVDRIERLFLAHPELRRDLGCSSSSSARYCQ